MSRLSEMIARLCPNGVEYRKLGEIVDYEQPGKYIVHDTNYDDSYDTPVLTAGQTFILGYTNEEDNHYKASQDKPVIIFDDFTTAFKWVDFEFKVKSSAMKILTAKSESIASLRYVFYAMQCIHYQPVDHSRHWIEKYSAFSIPLPPLEIQREIVQILDNFANLTAELTAELAKRKKQYEHYRDMLLNFEGGGRYDKFGIESGEFRVEWKRLGEIIEGGIINMTRGDYITKKDAKPGEIPVILGGQEPAYFINRFNHDGKAIVISRSGASAGFVSYWNEPIFVTDGFAFDCDESRLNTRYLFHCSSVSSPPPHNNGL